MILKIKVHYLENLHNGLDHSMGNDAVKKMLLCNQWL